VPGRNLIFLTFAAALAYRRGLRHVVAACARRTIQAIRIVATTPSKALQAAINLGMNTRLVLHTPLMWRDKRATWVLAERLGGAAWSS
jgi:7-cyano-7-deazaguanine synthase